MHLPGIRSGPITASLVMAIVAACGGGGATTAPSAAASAAATAAATAAAASAGATGGATSAPSTTVTGDTTPAIVSAANAFLATLSDTEKDAVLFDWTDTAQKQRWSNLPQGAFSRAGLMWGSLSDATKQAWLALMKVTLSEEGYNRVLAEWSADDQLAASGGGGGLTFGSQYYWIALIANPSETDPWQWQWGGHHVTVNATISGTEVALTPSFIGAQPATYADSSGTTVQPLGDIETEAFALVNSLDATQQAAAILGSSPIDLVLGPGQDGKTIQAEGIAGSVLTAEQRTALLQLMGEYGGLVNAEDAAVRMAELEANLDQTYFAWYGPTTAGSAAYFRITGPTIVVEYSPQSMGGDAANHIHGIYRDPTNDYGAAITQ